MKTVANRSTNVWKGLSSDTWPRVIKFTVGPFLPSPARSVVREIQTRMGENLLVLFFAALCGIA